MRAWRFTGGFWSVAGAAVLVLAVAILANRAAGGDRAGSPLATRLAPAEARAGEDDDAAERLGDRSTAQAEEAAPATAAQLGVERRDLAALSPAAATYLAEREPQWGVAVLLPERGAVYEANGDEPFPLASVTKVLAMLTLMDQAVEAERALEEWEQELLWYAITESDNAAMDWLWEEIGGGAAAGAFLRKADVHGIRADSGTSWGDVTATPIGMAQLLGRLAAGEILDEPSRAAALDLMAQVVVEQRWGASAAFPGDGAVAMKNGWYPALTGWRVTSVAMTTAGEPAIVVAFTRNQPSQEEGMATIEGVAGRIGVAIAGAEPGTADLPASGYAPTERLTFAPGADGLAVVEGACVAGSQVLGRAGAWTCTVGEAALDPCFPVEGADGILVCGLLPDGSGEGVAVQAGEALPASARTAGAQPWFLAFADGTTCLRARSAPLNDDGDRVTFACSDGGAVIGPLQQTEVIWALRSDAALWELWHAPVVRAWY